MFFCRHKARIGLFAVFIPAVIAVAGCSTVPSQGPSRQSVVDDGTQIDSPFLIVKMSDFALEKLTHFPGPSLYGRFGDYRGAVEQTIGVGDTVQVTIFEAANGGLFSQPQTTGVGTESSGSHSAQLPPQIVQRDGSITVPYAGRIQASGQTPQAVEKIVVERLTGKAIEPQAVVTLSNNIATSVTVNGEGVMGARVPLTARGDRLLDVVADAGGLRTKANETFLDLTRGGKTVRVPFQTLINNPKENIFARPGDTLTVIRYPLTFTAVGATGSNAVVPFDAVGISLEEAMGKVSGVSDLRGDPEGVFIFRYEPIALARDYPGLTPAQAALNLVPVVYMINMRDPRSLFMARRFSMHDKDIIYVSNSPYTEIRKFITLVNSISNQVVVGYSVYQSIQGSTSTAGIIAGQLPTAPTGQ